MTEITASSTKPVITQEFVNIGSVISIPVISLMTNDVLLSRALTHRAAESVWSHLEGTNSSATIAEALASLELPLQVVDYRDPQVCNRVQVQLKVPNYAPTDTDPELSFSIGDLSKITVEVVRDGQSELQPSFADARNTRRYQFSVLRNG
jgi:hypothetical protein